MAIALLTACCHLEQGPNLFVMIVDLNGKQRESDTVSINAGEGLIETIRIKNGQPRHFDAHMNKLREDAKILSMTVPTSDPGIANRIDGVLSANTLKDAEMRILLGRGLDPDNELPLDMQLPSLLITAEPLPPSGPVRAILAFSTQRDEHAPLSHIHTLNDPITHAARQEAADYGVDDALLLNSQGRLAEATDANVFLLIDGALVTPPVSEGAHSGLLRTDLLVKFRGQEMALAVDDIGRAEEAFLSYALGIRPLIEVASQAIGDGEPGLVTQMLAARV